MLYQVSNEKRAPGCSFRMPGRARFAVPTSHRHGVFFRFFLIQGAFLWDGLGWGGVGWDVDVHLHLRQEVDATFFDLFNVCLV